jgi:hypothetical protein
MFKKLCGENAFQHIKLATTMWKNLNGPNLSYDTGVAREKELLDRKEWWGLMCDRGSSVVRHDGTKECAMEMIEDLIQRRNQGGPVVLEIQKEMVDDKLSLEQTSAGIAVDQELSIAKQKFEEQIADLQESYDEALKDRDEQLAEILREQRDDLEKKLQRAGEAQENLKVTFEKLCEEKTAEYAQMVHELQEEKRQRVAEYAARSAKSTSGNAKKPSNECRNSSKHRKSPKPKGRGKIRRNSTECNSRWKRSLLSRGSNSSSMRRPSRNRCNNFNKPNPARSKLR